MNFSPTWRLWIKGCLNSTTVSVLVNGSLTAEFPTERGLRQGDLLSPFLFLIHGEALLVMMEEACSKGVYNGIKIGNEQLQLSHLQFADDTLFLGEWSFRNALNLMALLQNFELASGLKINLHKAAGLHYSTSSLPFTYLGLPVGANMKRVASWREVVVKMEKSLSRWKQKILSIGGRLTLVKSVLNILPLYFFSLFRATASTMQNLEKLSLNFFWGLSNSNRKIIWAKGSRLFAGFDDGGLNIGCLRSMNLALPCKWLWRFQMDNKALWARVITTLYGPSGGLNLL